MMKFEQKVNFESQFFFPRKHSITRFLAIGLAFDFL